MITAAEFESNLARVLEKMHAAAQRANRLTTEVKLLAVTKYQPMTVLPWLQRPEIFGLGEGAVQDALSKGANLQGPALWEFIGHLQSNKARTAVRHFARIQSVDRLDLVQTLQRIALEENRAQVPILLQINTARDKTKFGATTEEAPYLLEAALRCSNLRVEGLMTLAEHTHSADKIRKAFGKLAELQSSFVRDFGHPLPELSMGMSADFELAIEQGSTLVRLGSALFKKETALLQN